MGWALIGKRLVPDTTYKTFRGQIREIVSYIREDVFCDRALPEHYHEAIDEFERLDSIWVSKQRLVGADKADKDMANELANLQITQLALPTALQSLYDNAINIKGGGPVTRFPKYGMVTTRTLTDDNRLIATRNVAYDRGFMISQVDSSSCSVDYGVSMSRVS